MDSPMEHDLPPIQLTKHHGLGNDFLIGLDLARPVSDEEVRRLCDRRRGIGADGLIVAERLDGDQRWRMVLRNADGGRAEISGNGIRCLAQAIARRAGLEADKAHRVTVVTDAGERAIDLLPSNAHRDGLGDGLGDDLGDERWARVAMGEVVEGPALSDAWASVGVVVDKQASADVGNPHLVGFVNSIDEVDIASVGSVVEADYPDGLNVHVVEVVDAEHLRLKVWERGIGVTEACGSGACAAAWTANELGLAGETVEVAMPGGSVTVDIASGQAFLSGPAVFVAEVRVG